MIKFSMEVKTILLEVVKKAGTEEAAVTNSGLAVAIIVGFE